MRKKDTPPRALFSTGGASAERLLRFKRLESEGWWKTYGGNEAMP